MIQMHGGFETSIDSLGERNNSSSSIERLVDAFYPVNNPGINNEYPIAVTHDYRGVHVGLYLGRYSNINMQRCTRVFVLADENA